MAMCLIAARDRILRMEKAVIVEYWTQGSESDFALAKTLFESNRFSYCLFFIHLAIEKLLKGLIVYNTENLVPYDHNLVRLAELSGVTYSEEQFDLLSDITSFNIKGR